MVNHSLGMGGSPMSMLELACGLREAGFRVLIAAGQGGPLAEAYVKEGFTPLIIPRRGIMESGTIAAYVRLIRRERVDIVHLNTLTSYFKYPALAAKLCRRPVAWWIREDLTAKRCQRLLPWLRRLANAVAMTSHHETRHLKGIIPAKRLHVFHKGIRPENVPCKSEPFTPPNNRPLRLGFVGTLEERKGLHVLVEAVRLLSERGLEVEIEVIGEDPGGAQTYRKRIEARLDETGLRAHFHLRGRLANAREYYQHFDLFVLPTQWDCFPRVVMEAMLAHCPVITTDAGSNPELLAHGQHGHLVPPDNPEALANTIAHALEHPEETAAMAEAARQCLVEHFNPANKLAAVANFYRNWPLS